MVDFPHGGAVQVFRDYVDDGIASSGVHEPIKREIRNLLLTLEAALNVIAAEGGSPEDMADLIAQITAMEIELDAVSNGVASLRQAWVISHPALDLSSWTVGISTAPSVGAPLTVGAGFTLVTSLGGRALRVTGAHNVGPSGLDFIEPGKVYLYRFGLARAVDDPTTNLALMRLRAFGAGFNDLGSLGPAGTAVLTADGQVELTLKVSTNPANSDVVLPADAKYLRRYLSTGAATTGELDLLYIERDEVADVDAIAAQLAAGSSITDPEGSQIVLLNGAGDAVLRVSWADFVTKLNGDLMGPALDKYDASQVVGASPVVVIADDPNLKRVSIQNNSETETIGIAFGGRLPSLSAPGSWILAPGDLFSEDDVETGAVSVIASGEGVSITVAFANTGGGNPNAELAATEFLLGFTAEMTGPQQTAVKTLYRAMYSAGVLQKAAGGGLYVFAGANDVDAKHNWLGGASVVSVGAPALTPWAGFTFDGVDDALNTTLMMESVASITDHTLAVFADTTIQGSSKYAIGDSTVHLGPNRTSNSLTALEYASASAVVVEGVGGFQAITRTSSASFVASRDDTSVLVGKVAVNPASSYPVWIGARSASGGTGAGWYGGMLRAGYVGPALSQDQRETMGDALLAFFETAAGF